MNIIIKVLFSVLTKIALSACSEKVIEIIIFKLLEEAAKHSKTSFDDDLVGLVKGQYDAKQS